MRQLHSVLAASPPALQSHAKGRFYGSHWLTTVSGVFSNPSCSCAARLHVISFRSPLAAISHIRSRGSPSGQRLHTLLLRVADRKSDRDVLSPRQLITRGGRALCGQRRESPYQLVPLQSRQGAAGGVRYGRNEGWVL